jgi:hypothetical protein
MKFVPPDTCLADYKARRTAFVHDLIEQFPDDMKERAIRLRAWMAENSPYTDAERLDNLARFLLEECYDDDVAAKRNTQDR